MEILVHQDVEFVLTVGEVGFASPRVARSAYATRHNFLGRQERAARNSRSPAAGALRRRLNDRRSQYFGILVSTLSAHARIPPARFFTLRNPAWRRKSTALPLRTPERQWATISRLESSSFMRFGRSPSGIRCPLRLQIWYSCGSRTSRMKISSPASRRRFSSSG